MSETRPLGGTTRYTYNATTGLLAEKLDARGVKTAYAYDLLGRVVGVDAYAGGRTEPGRRVRLAYDVLEQVALVRVNDLALLTDYLDAACALAHEYLDGLKAAALDEVVDRSWDPPVTRAARLVSIIDDAAQHSGQAVYARRLLGLEG